jgi:hypothetical protein
MKYIIVIVLCYISMYVSAQELFSFTEPASNMAAKSIGIRLNNYLMKNNETNSLNYHLLPEVMIGVNKKLMLHVEAFLSNRNNQFVAEGASIYGKYRFLSNDEIHSHFRMAVYGRYSFNNSDIHQPAIDFFGHSSGVESGLIATKLIHKVAISSSIGAQHVFNNGKEKFNYSNKERNAISYSLSIGKLMLPKEYISYNQTNLNLMVEVLGQSNIGSGSTYLDIAPTAQLIFNSIFRVDIGYRFNCINTLYRTAPEGFLVRLEYNFFNALK